jgi:hypothetical protein
VNPSGISGEGTLFSLGFTAVGGKGSSSTLTLINRGAFNLDRLDVPLTATSGTVTVTDKALAPVGMEVIIGAVSLSVLLVAYSRKRA